MFLSDIVFIVDETESQIPYMPIVRANIAKICRRLVRSPDVDVRFCIITFRDYEPNNRHVSNAVRVYQFTNDIDVVQYTLSTLRPFGGGDGPEAQTPALYNALKVAWNEDAQKVVILVTDSPPHGIGEDRDDYPHKRSPDGNLLLLLRHGELLT